MNNIINDIREALIASSDEKTLNSGPRFFKETIKMHGVRIPLVHKISQESFKVVEGKTKEKIFQLCEELWKSGYSEESYIACNWSYYIHKKYEASDFYVFEKWVNNYVSNWATCDTLCNHTVGEFIEMYPEFIDNLKKWTLSDNRWTKRAAAVTLILPARKGLFLTDIFEIAETLLEDKDDLVQKGYGWMLKAASEAHQQEVFDFVIARKKRMPRTAYRYAIEKMPQEMRAIAMKKE